MLLIGCICSLRSCLHALLLAPRSNPQAVCAAMAKAQAALLEQLMGATRNLTAAERAQQKIREVSWRDDDICKYYIW